jgi:hypothetical protein
MERARVTSKLEPPLPVTRESLTGWGHVEQALD